MQHRIMPRKRPKKGSEEIPVFQPRMEENEYG